jgi:hypothetical protein
MCVIGAEEALEDREGPLQGDGGLLKLSKQGGHGAETAERIRDLVVLRLVDRFV